MIQNSVVVFTSGFVRLAGVDYAMRRGTTDIIARTEFEVTTTSPVENPSSLTVVLDGSVFARSEVTQSIALFVFVASSWVEVDARPASQLEDAFVQVDILSDFLRFDERAGRCPRGKTKTRRAAN